MRKAKIFALTLIILLLSHSVCFANDDTREGLESALDTLPESVTEALPEGIEEALSSPEKLSELFSIDYVFSLSGGLFKSALSSALKAFAFVGASLVISALFTALSGAFSNTGAQVSSLASRLCISTCAYFTVWSHVKETLAFSQNISAFMKALAVTFGAVYTSAGEIGSTAAHSAWAFSLTAVTEELCGGLLLPVMQISFSSSLVSSISDGVDISRLVRMIRNLFTSLLVFFMTVISVILAFQTVIAHTSDSLAMRGVRYVVSNSVPIIGGLVSDSARTLATGFSIMKNSVGFFGIAVVCIISLYPLVGLISTKYALQLSGALASILGEDKSAAVLDESLKMISFMMAVVIMLDVAFIFCISVFALLPAASI